MPKPRSARSAVPPVARREFDRTRSAEPRKRGRSTGRRGPGIAAFRTLIEDSDDGMILADAEGHILYANPAAERFLGYTPAELVGRLGFDMVRPDHLGNARDAFGNCLSSPGHPVALTVDVVRRDSGVRTLDVSLVNRLSVRGVEAVVVHFRDSVPAARDQDSVEYFSERKHAEAKRLELEAQLRQAQKMEAVGRMTGGIAHDFNNILLVIMANAELLAGSMNPEATAGRRDLEELRAAAERGATMIRKLLGFSRNASVNIAPINLAYVVRDLQGMLRHVVPENIMLELSAAEDAFALCDAGAIEQMLMNLATNARDAMPAGGTLRIDVRTAVIDRTDPTREWLAPGEFIRLSVSDTGIGMDDRTRAKAIDPFFTTKPPGAGTGLGLSMVYGLVKQQRGFIDLMSEPGRGTTVHLYFPRAKRSPGPQRPQPSAARVKGGSATILLIEDDASLQRTVRRVLERLGYRLLVAGDGIEGLALFREHHAEIDLVISDMIMPGLTGTQVYEAITREFAGVRFLLSSGYQDRPDRTHEAPPGVRVIAKPWTIDALARTVKEALEE